MSYTETCVVNPAVAVAVAVLFPDYSYRGSSGYKYFLTENFLDTKELVAEYFLDKIKV